MSDEKQPWWDDATDWISWSLVLMGEFTAAALITLCLVTGAWFWIDLMFSK